MKRVAVILSGCGVFDGSEIQEAVLTLLALDRAQASVVCAAPNIPQLQVLNHLTKEAEGSSRNVLTESARITRGNIMPLKNLKLNDIDAVIFPGGFGAAKNLCNYATSPNNFEVNPEVEKLLRDMRRAGKPMGFMCIAPVIAAKVFGSENVELTIGVDPQTAADVQRLGAKHVNCDARNIVIDRRTKIVTTPAYMVAEKITDAEAGINKLVQVVVALA
jgi:enhancing lycopene biosynthesis protein 2